MIEAIQDIDGIIKAIGMARLMNDGHIDGRVARGIANDIIKQAGLRFIETKEQLSRKEKELAEKDEQLFRKDKELQVAGYPILDVNAYGPIIKLYIPVADEATKVEINTAANEFLESNGTLQ